MELLFTYVAAVIALMVIPGPDMAYCAASPALHVFWLGVLLCIVGTAMNFGFGLLGSTASPLNRIVILRRSLAQYILSGVFFIVAVGFLLAL